MTVALATGSVVVITGGAEVTGQQLNIGQGSVNAQLDVLVSVTGLGLNIAQGSVFAGLTSIVNVNGNGLTVALNNNNINPQIWSEISTGTAATWTNIDTAA
jgi:hypothetical protein